MNPERELDTLLAQTLDASYGDIPDSVLERIVELEAIVALKRQGQGIAGAYSTNYLNRRALGARPVAQPNSRFLQMILVNTLSSNSNRDRQIEEKISRLKDLIANKMRHSDRHDRDRHESRGRRSRSPSPRRGTKRSRSRSPSSEGRPRRKQSRLHPPKDAGPYQGEDRVFYKRSEAIEISDSEEAKRSAQPSLRDEHLEKKGMRRIQKMKVRGRGSVGSKSDALYPMPTSNLSVSSSSSSSSSSSDESSSESRWRRRRKAKEKKKARKEEKKRRKERNNKH